MGEILLWRKAQKKETKKETSEMINRIIPVLSPFMTKLEWWPWIEASRWMSFHHKKAIATVIRKAIRFGVLILLFIRIRPERTMARALLDAKIGHGLTSTR